MSYRDYLEEMLKPVGIYDRETGVFQQGELEAFAGVLDDVSDYLEDLQQEMCLLTAEDWGMERMSDLFVMRPTYLSLGERREALLALSRISGDSFTVSALNQVLQGCGTLAKVAETESLGVVEITFPNIPGIPSGFDNICSILEYILPAHLLVRYYFWYVTWAEWERKIPTFGRLDEMELTWAELSNLVS